MVHPPPWNRPTSHHKVTDAVHCLQQRALLTYIKRVYYPFLVREPELVSAGGNLCAIWLHSVNSTRSSAPGTVLLGMAVVVPTLADLPAALQAAEELISESRELPFALIHRLAREFSLWSPWHIPADPVVLCTTCVSFSTPSSLLAPPPPPQTHTFADASSTSLILDKQFFTPSPPGPIPLTSVIQSELQPAHTACSCAVGGKQQAPCF